MPKKNVSNSPRILQIRQDRDYDCVYIGKRKIMLGRTGSPEAEAKFRQLQIQALTDPGLASIKPQQVTVNDLPGSFNQHHLKNKLFLILPLHPHDLPLLRYPFR